MAKKILERESDVHLIEVTHDSADVRAYIVTDRRRTPEPWSFGTYAEALAKYEERVENAKQQPPILPR